MGFSSFLNWVYQNKRYLLKNIIGFVVCSSSSILTKKYSYNNFDKNLVENLKGSENQILKISRKLGISCTIIRPSMIYGSSGIYKDKNFMIIKRILKYSLLNPLPYSNGLRQPIHCSQLANTFVKYLEYTKSDWNNKKTNYTFLNIGGDEEFLIMI